MSNTTQQDQIQRTQSVINRSAVKEYALKVSAERRAAKFSRVSEEFLQAVEAEVASAIRQLAYPVNDPVPGDAREFITGAAMDKLRERLNERARAIIQGKVQRHPSIGCTLKD
jgi:hypothetical protein